MDGASSPLHPLLKEINEAAQGGLPFLAVAMTVALPDICASLISPDGRTSGDRYKQWCDENLVPTGKFDFVTSHDLYSMRCGILHNGRFGDLKHSVGRVIFSLPGQGSFVNCQVNDAYFYSVREFCLAFTDAVYCWFEAHRSDPKLQRNLPRLMQYRNGLPPYVGGFTVLA